MTRYLITGASGLLGLTMALQLSEQDTVFGVIHQNALKETPFITLVEDLSQPGAVERVVNAARPDVIIHCAAMANLDTCEQHPQQAMRINAEIPGELAQTACRLGLRLVHISTDAVFDGQTGGYTEEDEPIPVNVYARSKLAGEHAVLAAYPEAIVARVNFYGWSLNGKRSLAELFFYNLSAGKSVNGFTDVFFCPLLANDLGLILVEMMDRHLQGLFHVVSPESLSKAEFSLRLARRFGWNESLIRPISWADHGLQAARSPNLVLRADKLTSALGRELPTQQQGIDHFYNLHIDGYRERIRSLAGVPV